MDTKQAKRRYFFLVLFPAMAVFLAASFGIAVLGESDSIGQPTLVAVSLIPIVALMITFWGFWRFTKEIDEYLRAIQIKALLVGLVTILVVATGWGYLETYADASDLELFWFNPIFWIAYSVGVLIFTLRDGGDAV